MISKDEVTKVIKSYLPNAEERVINQLMEEIICDVEPIIYSYIREFTLRERKSLYLREKDL